MSERIPNGDVQKRRDRLLRTEELMGQYFSYRSILRRMQQEFGLSPRQAQRYIRAVRRQWRMNGVPAERKAELRAKFEDLYSRAMSKKRKIKDENGELVEVEDPDFKSAVAALRQLAELDGVHAPQQHEHYAAPAPLQVQAHEVDQASQELAQERRLKLVKGEQE